MVEMLGVLIPVLAGLAALMGILVIESFFRDRFKNLFDDRKYFIIFFLVAGYFLYALGELSYYLTKTFLKVMSPTGIGDVYWVGGAAIILISFIALTVSLSKEDRSKLFTQSIIGLVLVGAVSYALFGVFLGRSGTFFEYYYPLMSALIVSFSLSVFFYYSSIEKFGIPLVIFSLASFGILVGDVLFSYLTAKSLTSGLIYTLGDIFYCVGYGLSFLGFVALYFKMRELTRK